ncbi:unnamed protein product, partial [Polarella glacialis]
DFLVLGVLGPITSVSNTFLATAVAFDIDFRKNFDASLRAQFGEPIVQIPNLNPNLRLKVQIGNSNSEPDMGVSTALAFFLGSNGTPPIAGLVGGYHSAISMPVASLAAVLKVPQVAWGSTSPKLSNKDAYPYFLRTMPPDSIQASAMWEWLVYFKVPSATFLYSQESYGEGLFQAVTDLAAQANEAQRVSGIGIRYMPLKYEVDEARATLQSAMKMGSKFLFLAVSSDQFSFLFPVLAEQGVLTSDWQLIGSEAIYFVDGPNSQYSSADFPVGFMKFNPVSKGDKFKDFDKLWTQLKAEDVIGSEDRYMLDKWRVSLDQGRAQKLSDKTFRSVSSVLEDPFLFDAGYTFVLAANELLNAGKRASEIQGELLLDALRKVRFRGISGPVSFNADGDRLASYELINMQPLDGLKLAGMFVFSPATNKMIFEGTEAPYWSDGKRNWEPASKLVACRSGYAQENTTNMCRACQAGSFSVGGPGANCTPCAAGRQSGMATGAASCLDCEAGKYAANRGSRICRPCEAGSYGNQPVQLSCQRCPAGSFAKEPGMTNCTACPAQTTTRFMGSSTRSDCACNAGEYRDLPANSSEQPSCKMCPEGMDCPFGSDEAEVLGALNSSNRSEVLGSVAVAELLNEINDTGVWPSSLPQLLAGYFSTAEQPMQVYRCLPAAACPGGMPGDCAGGRLGVPCAQCPEGMTWGGDACKDCDLFTFWGWIMVVLFTAIGLVVAYMLLNSPITSKASILLTTTCVMGMSLSMIQNLAIVGLITIGWPPELSGVLEAMRFFLLDLESMSFDCFAGRGASSYLVTAVCFPAALLWLALCGVVSQKLPHKFKSFRLTLPRTVSTMGQVLQVSSTVISKVALSPMMCYSHPNGN